MNRRNFLKHCTLLSTSLQTSRGLVARLRAADGEALASSDRALVIVELEGGCDGLNMLVPYSNDFYYSNRPRLSIPRRSVLPLDSDFGLHPAMLEIKSLYDQAGLAVIRGVGYPNPDRSHFRSRNIWHTAQPELLSGDGWLARYFSKSPFNTKLNGVSVGGRVPRALIESEGSFPSTRSVPNTFCLQNTSTPPVLDATSGSVFFSEGWAPYRGTVDYPSTVLGRNLQKVAQIISADPGVKVFYTALDGFDTHAAQVAAGDSASGLHANLLSTFSAGISSFLGDLKQMGRSQDVLVVSFSEFGRNLSENEGLGTDHGTANPVFVFGESVNPGLHETSPGLAPEELDDLGDMIHTVDFRSVYATLLAKWLRSDPVSVLGQDFPLLNFL